MARIRAIKPDVRRSRRVTSWKRDIRLAWCYLWCYLDDEGRGEDDLSLIKAECFPRDRDVTEKVLDGWLWTMVGDIDTDPPLCRYEVDGARYLHATHWQEHQRINRPQPSRLPPCPEHEGGTEGNLRVRDKSRLPHAQITEHSVNAAMNGHTLITEQVVSHQ